MAVPVLNIERPRNADATSHRETRDNFAAVQHLLGLAPAVSLTGSNAAVTDLVTADYGRFNLTTDAAGGANDFDLMLPATVGQIVTIYLVLKNTQNATVTADSGVTILGVTGSAVTTLTLDATDEYVVLRAINATTWAVLQSNCTIA